MPFLTGQLQAQFTDTITFSDNNERWGIKVLSTKKVLVEPTYQDLGEPNEGLVRARINDKTGFIDLNGKIVVPFEYYYANYFAEGLAAVSQETNSGMKIGFVDKTGKLAIEMKYYSMLLDRTRFYNGVAVVAKGGENKYGIIDRAGRELTDFVYSFINPFENSMGITTVNKSDKWALLDKTGKELTPFKYDKMTSPYYFANGLIRVEAIGKNGFIDYSGKEVVSPQFEEAGDYSEDLCAVMVGGKWGFIDKKGNVIIKYQFDIANQFSEGVALIGFMNQEGGIQWKCIDKTGKLLFAVKGAPFENGRFSNGLLLVEGAESKYFFLKKSGLLLSEVKYDNAQEFSESLAGVCLDGKCGYIDPTGKLVIPLKYTAVTPFFNGFAEVSGLSKNGEEVTFVIDKTGKVVTSY